MGCGKEDRRWKDGVDKPESGVTVALVRDVSTCHCPIISTEITKLNMEANHIILVVYLFTLSLVFSYTYITAH